MRLSAPYLKNTLEKALKYRAKILKNSKFDKTTAVNSDKEDCPFGEDVKMVRQHKLASKLLTPAEQDEAIAKYESGMTMTAVANHYGCHYTTIGRLLRKRGCTIRE